MKIYDKFGRQYIAYNVNELVALETTSLRVGTDGHWYILNSFDGGDNKFYRLVIKNFEGTKTLAIDEEIPYDTIP